MYKDIVIEEMKKVFKEVPFGIDHTLKVLGYAEEIMVGENVPEEMREIISLVAILHDIGALEAQNKYGSMEGHYQEKEGEIIARQILERVGYDSTKKDRVCYIVGNHHTPSKIDNLDFQIQWEADLLHNLEHMDIRNDKQKSKSFIDNNFKTNTGKNIAYKLFVSE